MARNKSDDAATPIKDGLCTHLREIRKRAGLTQEEIAEALLNWPSVGSIRRPTPDIATEHGGGALDPN